jgi:ankyrin repeat protein
MMLDAGVRISSTDAEGRNVLHYAAMCTSRAGGGKETISTLMRRPEGMSLIDSVDENGNTPLHLAATAGDVTTLQALQSYLPVEAKEKLLKEINFLGWNMLHSAAQVAGRDTSTMIAYLMDSDCTFLNGRDNRGQSPLHTACAALNIPAITTIVRHAACSVDVVAMKDHRGRTCLHIFVGSSREVSSPQPNGLIPVYEVVDQLIAKCPDLLTLVDVDGNTPLHAAAAAANRGGLKALLTNPNCEEWVVAIENKGGSTARMVSENPLFNRLFYPSNRTRTRTNKKKGSKISKEELKERVVEVEVEEEEEVDEEEEEDAGEPMPDIPLYKPSSKKKKKLESSARKRLREEELLVSWSEHCAAVKTESDSEHVQLLKFMRNNLKNRIEDMRSDLKELDAMIRKSSRK